MENGLLTVTVPKEGVKKHDVKAIEISGWMWCLFSWLASIYFFSQELCVFSC
jgi:hypothetical protein